MWRFQSVSEMTMPLPEYSRAYQYEDMLHKPINFQKVTVENTIKEACLADLCCRTGIEKLNLQTEHFCKH